MWLKDALKNVRNNKTSRMTIIGVLMIVVLLLLIFWKKGTAALLVIFVLLAIAMGLEGFDYDVDLQKLWETKSYSESRVERVTDSEWNPHTVITGTCNSKEFDLNCADFSTQSEAQTKYQQCADSVAADNPGLDVRKLDIYGLDGDNDGKVCEALPA